jgi:hypothetical protein
MSHTQTEARTQPGARSLEVVRTNTGSECPASDPDDAA